MTPQPHCDHECVCWMYIEQSLPEKDVPCPRNALQCWATCKKDTRTPRPAPSPIRSMREDEDGHVSWQQMNEKALAEHDAAIAAQAREKVLKLLEEWDYHNNRNFGKPHPVFSDMIRLVRENPDEVRKHLESLRTEGGERR